MQSMMASRIPRKHIPVLCIICKTLCYLVYPLLPNPGAGVSPGIDRLPVRRPCPILWAQNPHVLCVDTVSYTHLRAHETRHDLVCRLLLEKKKKDDNNHQGGESD
eukprot:TRINITY_DN17569_c0_g2_i1.p6 TRINITY_DN17569_c0_g2~~TRINITY_DN17569_c0_g2_i1.p6  ORF type:complete len:105 (-),score=6.70 TRINITY_DN17569_c0_g2_i1:20-334(-)